MPETALLHMRCEMKKKLLMVASTWQHIRNFHLPYLTEFRNQGYMVTVACAGVPENCHCCDSVVDIPFTKSMTSLRNVVGMWKLRKMIRREKYDLVIVHTTLAAFFTRIAVKGFLKRPVIVNVVHGYLFDDQTPWLKRMLLLGAEKLTAGETDLLLTMNRWDFDLAEREHLGKQIMSIPGMGVDFSRLECVDDESESWIKDIPKNAFVVTFAAEFSVRKNQKLLIDAFSELPKSAFLVLAGDGQLKENCRQYVALKGLSDRILFPGYVHNIASLYAKSQVIASSSRIEGLPFNILEAMFMKKPVVATRVKGHTDLVREGINGFLYETPAQCAAAIRKLISDPELSRKMGEQAGEQVRQYSLTEVLPAVMDAYTCVNNDRKNTEGQK